MAKVGRKPFVPHWYHVKMKKPVKVKDGDGIKFTKGQFIDSDVNSVKKRVREWLGVKKLPAGTTITRGEKCTPQNSYFSKEFLKKYEGKKKKKGKK